VVQKLAPGKDLYPGAQGVQVAAPNWFEKVSAGQGEQDSAPAPEK
jgi:hypothetical protein